MTTADASGTETGQTTTETQTTTTETESETVKELEKWKAESRKQEQRAKENAQAAKDLAKLKAETMSETEKAVAQAKAEGLAEGQRTGSALIAQAEIRAAAAGRNVDVDALLEGVDATRFVNDAGEVDRAAISAWVDRVAPATEPTARTFDLGQGARGGQPPALNDDPLLKALAGKVGVRPT